ncbi:MAG TPA: cupin domain-containing protein [Acidobacteriaceae bacterium]|jgi:mannose-6-phosphate isomerase-like protein (cupin superfamily)|nr:cupin domain-containing protein [Acidobacteriaceae bacterium]
MAAIESALALDQKPSEGAAMMPVSAETAEHYVWGQQQSSVCDGWHLVQSEGLSVIEERMPPEAREERHLHSRARQFFYVLEGELTLEVDGREHGLGVGQGLEVPPGSPHQALNATREAVRFLVVSSPPGQGDRKISE